MLTQTPNKTFKVPVYACSVECGFPSPADDYIDGKLDLNEHLIKQPAATFFVRASGNSMIGAGIFDGDILIVDRSITPTDGKIVIAVVSGDMTVKRLCIKPNKAMLLPENVDYKPIIINKNEELTIWGVVTNVIHKV
jgi:DNA polymerase V